jgi:hypothetical protein
MRTKVLDVRRKYIKRIDRYVAAALTGFVSKHGLPPNEDEMRRLADHCVAMASATLYALEDVWGFETTVKEKGETR